MLYIQKSVSENAAIAVKGVEKYKNLNPPTIKCDTTSNFLLPTTIYHVSTLAIVWSLFVDAPPPPAEFLKNALIQTGSLSHVFFIIPVRTKNVSKIQFALLLYESI
jgi:hypothetical protein